MLSEDQEYEEMRAIAFRGAFEVLAISGQGSIQFKGVVAICDALDFGCAGREFEVLSEALLTWFANASSNDKQRLGRRDGPGRDLYEAWLEVELARVRIHLNP